MREILKITANLLAICLVAAGLLGGIFIHTEAARHRNEEARLATARNHTATTCCTRPCARCSGTT